LSSALVISSLSKSFEGQQALKGVDFDVQPGEVHALVGQNGSGKSTLVKVLAGYERPDPGSSARIGDDTFSLGDPAAARRAHLCFVHQDLGLIDSMSVAENIALGTGYETGAVHRIKWAGERTRARAALDFVGSSIDVRAMVGDLRPVDKAEVAIARAMAVARDEGRFIILDEPTAALPRAEAGRLFELVRALVARGMGVVFVGHHLEEVLGIADRVTVLRDGVRVATEDAGDLDRDRLAALIVGRHIEAHANQQSARATTAVRSATLVVTALAGRTLDEIDFSVESGEILGVAGIVGSGREEIAPLVFGAESRTGNVAVTGTPVAPDSPPDAIAAGLALVPAMRVKDGLVSEMSVAENLTLADLRPFWRGMWMRKVPEREEVARWIDELQIHPRAAGVPVHTLSGGNQQKVLLAKWLRLAPSVLVLDEPTQGVDVGAKVQIYGAVERAAAAGAAVLVSSSDPEELAVLCDRVLVLRRGKIHTELTGHFTAAQINELSL
jgi:ribose transport system ATP-binding protein